MIRSLKSFLHAAVLTTACVMLAQMHRASAGQIKDITLNPGYVAYLPLADFAPEADVPALKLLLAGNSAGATTALQARLAEKPHDLFAYLGMLQARPDRCDAAIRQAKSDSWEGRVKLGIAVKIKWAAKPIATRVRDEGDTYRARAILERAWQERRTVLLALLIVDIPITGRGCRLVISPRGALLACMKDILGPGTYPSYVTASRTHWRQEPPPIRSVPHAARRELWVVLRVLRSMASSGHGRSVMKNGRYTGAIVWAPITAEKMAEKRYFGAWIQRLDEAIRRDGGSTQSLRPVR